VSPSLAGKRSAPYPEAGEFQCTNHNLGTSILARRIVQGELHVRSRQTGSLFSTHLGLLQLEQERPHSILLAQAEVGGLLESLIRIAMRVSTHHADRGSVSQRSTTLGSCGEHVRLKGCSDLVGSGRGRKKPQLSMLDIGRWEGKHRLLALTGSLQASDQGGDTASQQRIQKRSFQLENGQPLTGC